MTSPSCRPNEIYCDLKNVDGTPTCRDKGASETYKKSLESNPALLLYRRTYQQKVMTVYRNKENKQLKKDFDKWKKEAQISLYWGIGQEIYKQQNEKGWGKSIVEVLSKEIRKDFPDVKGFSSSNLWRMRNFYVTYSTSENLAPLVREISWSKNIAIMEKCKEQLEREFYIKMTKKYGWTKDVLINHIENKSYEKYLLNQTNFDETVPEKYVNQAKLAVKDEYVFDFMELSEQHSERELEESLINNIRAFLEERDTLLEKMKDLLPSPEEIEKRLKDL